MHLKPPLCFAIYDRDTGLVLRILKYRDACMAWLKKHFPGKSQPIAPVWTPAMANAIFDKQMQLGLIDNLVIQQLLYFGGVTRGKTTSKVRGIG